MESNNSEAKEKISLYSRLKNKIANIKKFLSEKGLLHTVVFAFILLVSFCIFLIIDNAKISKNYYTIYENGNMYKYVLTSNEVRLDSYAGDKNSFSIPEKISIRRAITRKDFTVNSIHLENLEVDKLYIPKTITKIDSFGHNFNSVEVSKDNPIFDSRDNCNCICLTKENKIIAASNKNSFIPNTIVEIGEYAFYRTDYQSIELPSGVKNIDEYSFSYMYQLEKITFNNDILVLSSYAFLGCTKLKSVILPKSLIQMSSLAFFEACVESVYFKGTKEEFDAISNNSVNKQVSSAYDKDNYYFKSSRAVYIYFYSEKEPIDKGNTWHYENNEAKIWE